MTSKTTAPVNGAGTKAAVEPTTPVATSEPVPKKKAARKAKADLTLADLAERFIEHLEDEGKSPGTCSSYGAELKLAIKGMGGATKIASITTDQVAVYFDSKAVTKLRSGRKKAKPSIDKSRRVLRLALCYAAEKRWLREAPIPDPTTKG